MDFTSSDIIIGIIQTAIILLPVLGFVWKFATATSKIESRVEQNEKKIEEVESKLTKDVDSLGEKYRDLQLQRQNELINLTTKVDKLDRSVVALSTNSDHVQKSIEEMKQDIKTYFREKA